MAAFPTPAFVVDSSTYKGAHTQLPQTYLYLLDRQLGTVSCRHTSHRNLIIVF